MGKPVSVNPKPTVISVRVTDDQMEEIRRLMEKKKMSASDIMREAFCSFVENAEQRRMDAIRAAALKYTEARGEA
ncbi:CopG domain protein DNA-binding domain protein [Geobacter metallireducens RCH3]|uniref:Transcriptional repressor, HgtR-related protein n=1 Tax=Geobacter metallireducens (strain ATCC 53774 / DSM 7210 / GS-15) TaxID=269799 RepID=Q39WT7_GEOMG|nr:MULTISPECIES: ribbon-helix-helix protein, CopG family [Geobacter]ABB31287.1 transcriptional repressor, HgtR-related protein [Geobacter metallireducens GS-15]EHP86534.1 CopG domain protein DNA-binding domain protein [Geobacter metallireducens RCH3]MBT1076169.1 ribbon-helix-helix protein, CopG family [Geobacter grbiciae]